MKLEKSAEQVLPESEGGVESRRGWEWGRREKRPKQCMHM
jgi:hypothetical protein